MVQKISPGKQSRGQTNAQQQQFRMNPAGMQQSVIEEEAELEEQEDSPRARESNNQLNERREGFKLYRTDVEEDEAKLEEVDHEDLNDDIGVVVEDDDDDAFSNHSLLYEREIPDGMILQVIHAPSGDPESVFIVR